jgi:hypothetical protein
MEERLWILTCDISDIDGTVPEGLVANSTANSRLKTFRILGVFDVMTAYGNLKLKKKKKKKKKKKQMP